VAGEPQLQKGDSGEWVQHLQQLLQSAGYWSGEADGSFGEELEQAVMQLQSSNGLSADGVVRADAWAILTGDSETPAASTSEEQASGEDAPADGVPIDLSEFPAISALANIQSESDVDQYLASLGIDASTFADEGEAIA
jgi:peptidoglycan hydrolase-like protein with peptidoglycan-binding domain